MSSGRLRVAGRAIVSTTRVHFRRRRMRPSTISRCASAWRELVARAARDDVGGASTKTSSDSFRFRTADGPAHDGELMTPNEL